MVSVTGNEERTYRSSSTGWIADVFVFFGLMIVILGIGGIVSPRQGDSAIRIVGILVVVAGCLVIVWVLRVGPDGSPPPRRMGSSYRTGFGVDL